MHAISCPLYLERRHSNLTKNRTCPWISVSWERCCGWLVHRSLSSVPLSCWRLRHEGRVSGLQQCNNFFFPALSYDPMILACEGPHSSSHTEGCFLIVTVTKSGAPQIYVYLCCRCSETGITTSRNAQDSPAQENCLNSTDRAAPIS